MSERAVSSKSRFQELFLQEEFRGDRLINNIRFFILFVLLALALVKAGLFSGLVMTDSLRLTLIIIGTGYLYTVVFFLLYRSGVYHPVFKFLSITLDITLAVLSIYSYKLDAYPEYAQIFLLARFSIIFWFIFWSLVRYNVALSFYSGLLAGAEYLLLAVMNNDMNGLAFSFVAPDGLSYLSSFTRSESILRVVYVVLAGGMAAVVAQRLRVLLINSISQEEAKNALVTKNRVVEAVNRENRKYLDGITQGLLLVDPSSTIGEQYSRFLTRLFSRDDIAGINLVDFLFPDRAAQEQDRRELSRYLRILFTSTTADEETLRDVNPLTERTFRIVGRDGSVSERVLAVSFHRLYENGAVTNVMVIFDDRTDVAAAQHDLEVERHRHSSELETVTVILRTGPRALKEFIEDSRRALTEALDTAGRLEDREVLNRTFRNLHGLKGSASSLGFTAIAELAHAAEDVLAQIRDGGRPVTPDARGEVERRVKEVFSGFDAIQKLTKSFLDFSQMEQPAEAESSVARMGELIESLRSMTADLAPKLGKKASFVAHNALREAPFLPKLRNPLIHLVRNAVDHGLEDGYERLSSGKPEAGTITLRAFIKDRAYVIEVSDDGRGLDFGLIRKKAVERGLLSEGEGSVPDSRLLEVLFAPGFSTLETATTVSGRGVGLDIVRDAMREVHGRIAVSTAKDKGTRFTLTIPARS